MATELETKLKKLLDVFEVPEDAQWLVETRQGILHFVKKVEDQWYFQRANTKYKWIHASSGKIEDMLILDVIKRSVTCKTYEPSKGQSDKADEIAPHEGNEVNLVLWGKKPLATLEAEKQPASYQNVINNLQEVLSVKQHSVGLISITLPENKHLHDIFALLSSPKASVVVRSAEEKHRLLGRLFGYTEEQIDAFIKADMKCACGQCRFEE